MIQKTHEFNPSILRAYDVRGIYNESLSEQDAYFLGKAYATRIIREKNNPNPKIAMARDARLSSPPLSQKLAEGMMSAGAHILDVGVGPTPMLYFSVYHLQADGGIMVTGSHNPPTHNGFKMTLGTKPFFGEDIFALGEMTKKGDLLDGVGSKTEIPVLEDYVTRLIQGFQGENAKDLTVVWDAGNGATGEVMSKLAAKLPGKHFTLFAELDGTFPNHHPDPSVEENLQDLIAKVKAEKADLGIAFDGDGDRIGAVDAQGKVVWGDQLVMFFAREILSRNKGATIIADVKASQTLFDDVAANGGNPLMWKTGHSLIKAKMAETKAALAGEMSGHIFFADGYYGYDDGLYAAVRLLDLLAHAPQSLAQMREGLPEIFNTPEIRIDCEESRKFALVEEIRDRLKKTDFEVNEVDGVRVKAEGGWWLARASNTQAAVIIRCEAQSPAALERLKAMVSEQLIASGVTQDLDAPSGGHH